MNLKDVDEESLSIGLLQEIETTSLTDDEDVTEEASGELAKKYVFPISKKVVEEIYHHAGEVIFDQTESICSNIPHTMQSSITVMVEKIRKELKLEFNLNDMQLKALHAIGHLQV